MWSWLIPVRSTWVTLAFSERWRTNCYLLVFSLPWSWGRWGCSSPLLLLGFRLIPCIPSSSRFRITLEGKSLGSPTRHSLRHSGQSGQPSDPEPEPAFLLAALALCPAHTSLRQGRQNVCWQGSTLWLDPKGSRHTEHSRRVPIIFWGSILHRRNTSGPTGHGIIEWERFFPSPVGFHLNSRPNLFFSFFLFLTVATLRNC